MGFLFGAASLSFAKQESELSVALRYTQQEPWEKQHGPRTDEQDQSSFRSEDDCSGPGDCREARQIVGRAENLAASDHYNEAIKEMSRALPLNSDLMMGVGFYIFRAKLYMKVGKKNEAKKDLQTALSMKSFSPETRGEAEEAALDLGDYKLVEKTILYDSKHTREIQAGIPYLLASQTTINEESMYLLGQAQEHLGKWQSAIKSYLTAAPNFMAEGRGGAAAVCVKRASAIAHKIGDTRDLQQVVALSRRDIDKLMKLVSDLSSSPNCFNPKFIETVTGVTFGASKQKDLYESGVSSLRGIYKVSLDTSKDTGDVLRVRLDNRICFLRYSDFEVVLKNRKQLCGRGIGSGTDKNAHIYKVPGGVLALEANASDFPCLADICIYEDKGQFDRQQSLPHPDYSILVAPHTALLLSNKAEYDKYCKSQGDYGKTIQICHLLGSGQIKEALKYTDDWIKQNPNNKTAQMERAEALARAGCYTEAINMINLAMNNKQHAIVDFCGGSPFFPRGTYLLKLGKYAQALSDFNHAFSKPCGGDQYYLKARAELGLGQTKEAVQDLQHAVDCYYNEARIVRRDEVQRLLNATKRKTTKAIVHT